VESGDGMAVTEADYRTGLITGQFLPPPPGKIPNYEKTNRPTKIAFSVVDEFGRGFWRRMGEIACQNEWDGTANNPERRKMMEQTMAQMKQLMMLNQMDETMRELQKEQPTIWGSAGAVCAGNNPFDWWFKQYQK
jgi:hypothetical protein